MVSTKSITTGLLALALSTMAMPTADVSTKAAAADIEARQTQSRVRFCEHPNWTGACVEYDAPWGVCQNLPTEWNDRASSVKAIYGNQWLFCIWYEHGNCQGRSYNNQEDANLSDGDGFFDDRISSWRCG
ncbi:hypothetical protein V8F20_009405 [Naviculisporaceae sp. PSN 640]